MCCWYYTQTLTSIIIIRQHRHTSKHSFTSSRQVKHTHSRAALKLCVAHTKHTHTCCSCVLAAKQFGPKLLPATTTTTTTLQAAKTLSSIGTQQAKQASSSFLPKRAFKAHTQANKMPLKLANVFQFPFSSSLSAQLSLQCEFAAETHEANCFTWCLLAACCLSAFFLSLCFQIGACWNRSRFNWPPDGARSSTQVNCESSACITHKAADFCCAIKFRGKNNEIFARLFVARRKSCWCWAHAHTHTQLAKIRLVANTHTKCKRKRERERDNKRNEKEKSYKFSPQKQVSFVCVALKAAFSHKHRQIWLAFGWS